MCDDAATEDSDFCEGCATTEGAVQEGDVYSLRCPWCDEFGDFTHLHDETPSGLVDTAGPPGREVACGSCGCTSYVLDAVLHLRIQRTLTPDEEEESRR